MLIAAKRKKQEVAGKIGHDEYAYKIKGEASNLPENRRVREQGEFTPFLANYNNNDKNNNNNENVSRNAIRRPPYGIDEDNNINNNNNNNNNNKNVNVVPASSPFMAGYISPYPQSPSPQLGGPMYNNPNNNYYPNNNYINTSNNNNNYLYRPASTPIPAQSVVPPMPSLPPCPDLPGPLPAVYRPKPPLMLQRGVEGSGDNISNDYLNNYCSNNNNNYISPSFASGVNPTLPSALSQTPSQLPQIGKEHIHDSNAPLRIRSAPLSSSGNDPYNNNNAPGGGASNNNNNLFGIVDEKVDEIQRKIEERRKAQSLQQDNARQMEEQRLRKAAERAKQIQEERDEDERVQKERELVVAKEQTEIAREAYEKQLKENGPIAAEPLRLKYEECLHIQREKEMQQQKDNKRLNSATRRLSIIPSVGLPITNPNPLPSNTAPLAQIGEKESTRTLENKLEIPPPSPQQQPITSETSSTVVNGSSPWPQSNSLTVPFTSPTLYDTTSKTNNKITLAPLWTPPPPPQASSSSSNASSALQTHDITLSLDPSYSNNNKLFSGFNSHPVSSALLSTPHLHHTSALPLSRVMPETSIPHQNKLSSSFSYENDTLRDEIHELADNQQRMESLLRSNERVAQNNLSSSLLPANMLNGLQSSNTPIMGNNFNSSNYNNFVPNSIIHNRRNSNNSNSSSARRRNNNNSSSRSNSKSSNNNSKSPVRSTTPNVVMTGNTFLTRNLISPQPQLQNSNLLYSNMNSFNNTNNTPYDANSTAPFVDNAYATNTRLASIDNDIQDNNDIIGSDGRRRSSLVKFTENHDTQFNYPKDLMVSTRLIGGNENESDNNNEPMDALTARGDYLMNLAQLHSSGNSGNSMNNMPEVRLIEKELSVEPSLFIGASSTTIQKTPQSNSQSNSSTSTNVKNVSAVPSSTAAMKAPVKSNITLTLSPRTPANASSSAAKQRIIKEDSSDEEELERKEEEENEE